MTPGERAKAFVDEILIPREVDAELGRLTPDDVALIRREALARELSGGLRSREHGGQGWSHVEWFGIEEQFVRSTNALSWHVPTAYNVLAHGSPEQIDRWLRPALRGELHDAYAVTEEHAESDPSGITATATPILGGWRLDGEKWFVTYGDVAAVYIVMALVPEPTLFGGEALLGLARLGYRGRVFAVNPRRASVHGVKAYPALEDLPETQEEIHP
jgi:acyl-CoA dehydrogenase